MMTKKRRRTVFYIDPQSMINLAKYDYHLLRGIKNFPIVYFCSKYYDYEENVELTYKKVFAYNKMTHNWQKAMSYVCSWFLILLYVTRLRPRVVHIQWFRIPRFDYVMVRLMQGLYNVKIVYTAHNILPHQGNENKSVDAYKKAYHAFDRIIVHSQATKQELVQLFGINDDKVKVIHHGILPFSENQENEYRSNHEEYDKKYAVLRNKTVFASLGYQNFYKGTDLLARVWASTPALCQNNEAMLLIIGKVNEPHLDLSMLKGLDNVICDNRRIPDGEFLYLLRHIDVYLLPYREISQSGALLTVLPEHVPLLLTDVGSLAEPLSVARIGWKMESVSEDGLRAKLLYLVTHKEEIETVREDRQAWEKVCLFYEWGHISLQTQQLYESLL